jgi:DNA repair protein RadC
MQNKSIKNWAEQDRPREKLLDKGANTLSDSELLAILLSSGNIKMSAVELARHILNHYDNKLSRLSRCTPDELKQFPGVGDAKAVSIIAALELGRRRKDTDKSTKYTITSSKSAFNLLEPLMSDLTHEEFWVLYLDRANHIIDKVKISQGGTTGTVMDVKIIIKQALDKLTQAIIIAHNHPSGNRKPSNSDIQVTNKIKEAAAFFDINLLDHIIVADNDYFSFADEGILTK